jgi:nucleotide-binding universal stress UspA family protein
MFDTVVVGADDSAGAAKALRRALDLVRTSGGTLHVVSALRPKEEALPDLPEEFRYTYLGAGATDWLHGRLHATAEQEHVHVETHPVLADPVDAITRVAAEQEADLIIVGSRDHHGTRRLSGVPRGVMDRASCAVLVV